MNSDFGGIKDAAAYQAIVCLIGEHKDVEAKSELRKFLKDYRLSPLVHAAHRRLARINGKSTPEDDALLQAAVTAQEKHIRQETAMCGPKCIVKLLELLHHPAVILSENQASGEGPSRRTADAAAASEPSPLRRRGF